MAPAGGIAGLVEAALEGPAALRGGWGGAAGAEAALLMDPADGAFRSSLPLAVGAEGVEGVVGEDSGPDEVPDGLEGVAG